MERVATAYHGEYQVLIAFADIAKYPSIAARFEISSTSLPAAVYVPARRGTRRNHPTAAPTTLRGVSDSQTIVAFLNEVRGPSALQNSSNSGAKRHRVTIQRCTSVLPRVAVHTHQPSHDTASAIPFKSVGTPGHNPQY